MNYFFVLISTLLALTKCTTISNESDAITPENSNKIIVAYVNSWEEKWGDNYEKANQITHINYAFANIEKGLVVEGSSSDTEILKKLNGLKAINKDLKILISVGGWSWSKHFSDVALTGSSREIFANSAIDFMQRHQLDGIDLDWEYPGLEGDGNVFRTEDKENFTFLLQLLREKLDSINSGNLLTIATGGFQNYLDHTNMMEAQKYLDFINIMSYDFHGGWEGKTGHHSNLNNSSYDNESNVRSVLNAVEQHLAAGIPSDKLVVGVPFYGRWWKGTSPINNGLYQPTSGTGGSYNYYQIVDSLNSNSGFESHWDSSASAPYIWQQKDSMFLTYDNVESIKIKTEYVLDNNLRGIMFWQFNGDNGDLLKTISDKLN